MIVFSLYQLPENSKYFSNARAFLKKLVTHVLIMRKTSNGLWGDSF